MNNDEQQQALQPVRSFNPNEHVIQLKSGQTTKDYLPVQWRLVWFRTLCPQGTIETEMLHLDLDRETEEEGWVWNAQTRRNEKITKRANGFVVFKATVKDGRGGMATGTKSEKAASFSDFIEKAETGAIGRALAALGYGTQFAPELDEAHRIVDAPVERYVAPSADGNNADATNNAQQSQQRPAQAAAPTTDQQTQAQAQSTNQTTSGKATGQQIESIGKLSGYLKKQAPDTSGMSYMDAKKLIQQLTAEYRESRQKAS
jgi:hypothetical protein